MNVVALICARGGSKGLPGKNIRLLSGQPLINWAIKQALSLDRVNRTIVSTDSKDIAEIALKAGAEVPFIRPAKLAEDDSPEWSVWRHALSYLRKTDGAFPDVLLVMPVTAPLRTLSDLERCLDEYEKGQSDVVITVTDSHRNPYFNMVKMNDDGQVSLVIPPKENVFRRQDAPKVYDMTTVAFIAKPQFVMDQEGIWQGRVSMVHIPIERALDIDTAHDFRIAEYLISSND